jgi:hypothetical protein
MPERPHPDVSRVRDALRERDETVPEPEEETATQDDASPEEDDGDA